MHKKFCSFLNIVFILCILLSVNIVYAINVEAPTNKYLFKEDSKEYKKYKKSQIKKITNSERPVSKALDFNAPEIEFLQGDNQVKGSGGVIISHGGIGAQSDSAIANLRTKDAILYNDVLFTMDEGSISAKEAEFNFDSEKGSFNDSQFIIEEGNYKFNSQKLVKIDDDNFNAQGCAFSTCHCQDKNDPWSFKVDDLKITQEGYARGWNATFNVYDVPVMYLPYVAFPVKQERSSGLLIPEFSTSKENGFGYKQPVYFVLSDQTDITIAPFVETKSRIGSSLDFRSAFSERNNVKSRFYFSDESQRNGDLRGTDVTGMADPKFDENRFAAYYNQSWTTKKGAAVPVTFISDVHYASDDLFIKEIEDDLIGKDSARYLTSKAALTASPLDFAVAEVSGEYNQSIYEDDDRTFHRLPEFKINTLNNFRPFGYNPLGLKFVLQNDLSETNFSRSKGYEGWRTSLIPSIKMPFHYKNYFDSYAKFTYNYADYNLSEDSSPVPTIVTDDEGMQTEVFKKYKSDSRFVPIFNYHLASGIERVFDVDEDSIINRLTTLGAQNSGSILKRLKNKIEPSVDYKYVTDVDQDDLPYFDSDDRIRKTGVVTYALRSSIFGRYSPRYAVSDRISELTPELSDLPLIDTGDMPSIGGNNAYNMPSMNYGYDAGSIREMMALTIKQSYDHTVNEKETGLDRASDVEADLDLYFSNYFATRFESNISHDNGDFTSYGITSALKDDRGDNFKVRYTFMDNKVLDQIEGNVEFVLTDFLRTGYYNRYDIETSNVIEQQIALRFLSLCNCWHIDLGYATKTNPDNKKFILSFTLGDLGGLTQSFGVGSNGSDND